MSEASQTAMAPTVRRPVRIMRQRAEPRRTRHLLHLAPLLLLILGSMLPAEVRINLAGQTLYSYRIVCLLLFPWVLGKVLSGAIHLKLNDILITIAALWMTVSFVVIYGFAQGFAPGVALSIDVLVPYLIARIVIRDLDDFRRLLIYLAPVVLMLAVLLPVEGLLGTRFIRNGAAAIFGPLSATEFGSTFAPSIAADSRWGLLRAMGPFSHPILAGLFFCSLLPLYYFSRLRGWPMIAGVLAGLAAIFTFSSAAMIGLFLGLALGLYDRLRSMVAFLNWQIFIGFVSLALLGLHLVSQNGLLSVLIRMTFNPQSGYYRMLIWEFGSQSVARHPWVGIGFEQFEGLNWMGTSIDAYWLAVAIRNGLPPALLLALATALTIIGLSLRAGRTHGPDQTTYIGFAITSAILLVLGFTVSFFGGLLTWFMVLLGIFTTFSAIAKPKRAGFTPGPLRYPA